MMQHEEWYIEGCVKATEEEWALYREWTGHLPVREESTPYHSGPHSIKNFRHALAIAGLEQADLFKVLEIGFCLGHSAEMFYRLGAASVTSIESSDRDQTLMASAAMTERHGKSFQILKPGAPLIHRMYEFGFIDGDHSEAAIEKDLQFMLSLGIQWILFDDWFPHWGDTQIVLKKRGIAPVAILGTMALCKFP